MIVTGVVINVHLLYFDRITIKRRMTDYHKSLVNKCLDKMRFTYS